MYVTPSGIITLVSDLQPSNALGPIHVTFAGIFMFVSDLQQKNAASPILVNRLFSPNVMFVSELQPQKA
jgi:hypothetical protein